MFNKWLDNDSKALAKELVKINGQELLASKISGFGMKKKVIDVIKDLRTALFPSIYESELIDESYVTFSVNERLNNAAMTLNSIIKEVCVNSCEKYRNISPCDECSDKANEITISFMNKLSYVRNILSTDIKAAYNGDPAAKNFEEILLSYPSLEAVTIQRMAHELFVLGVPLIPRIMTEYAHSKTGIDIHPGATIGKSFFMDHGTGIVIGETCVIGNNVKLYQGVTLGAKSFELDKSGNPVKGIKRHPNIEDNVIIYAGTTILGGDTTIGHDSVIGGNVWLTESIPPYSNVYATTPKPVIKKGNINK